MRPVYRCPHFALVRSGPAKKRVRSGGCARLCPAIQDRVNKYTSEKGRRCVGVEPLEGDGVRRLNRNLRKLVEQLGEAIHESVSESEQIAGVVQDIRRQGFDVLLMLEATIGLNEVVTEPAGTPAADGAAGAEFTAQDVSFLRSLRIAIEGDAQLAASEGGSEDTDEGASEGGEPPTER